MASAAQSIQEIAPPREGSGKRLNKPPAKVLPHPAMKDLEMFRRLLLAERPMPAPEKKISAKPEKKDGASDYVREIEEKFEKEEREENNKYLKGLELKVASL